MTEDYSGVESMEGSPSSEDSVDDYQDDTLASGDIDVEGPEVGDDGQPSPIPYERFKQSRKQFRELKDQHEQMAAAFNELRGRTAGMEQYVQHLQAQSTRPSESEPEDEFADPLEKKVAKLESMLGALSGQASESQNRQMVKEAEREIRAELGRAKSKYPDMNDLFVLDALARNPNAKVLDLAKKSHIQSQKQFEAWASKRGYKPRARRLVPAGQKGGSAPADIGDDLDKAEAAAIEYLLSIE